MSEFGWLALPASAAIVILLLLGHMSWLAALLGLVIAMMFAFLSALERARERLVLSRWLELLTKSDHPDAVPLMRGPMSVNIVSAVTRLRLESREAKCHAETYERLLDALVEALPDPVMILDEEMIVLRANAATGRTFDNAEHNIHLARVLRDPGLLAAVGGAIQGNSGSQLAFSPATSRDKRFAAWVEPIALSSGRPGVLVCLREQTEQVMIERMRSDFVANASHEIRTPLTSLQGFIETLRGPARDDPEARETFLATMAEETARMNRLVNDLLSLSQIELAAHRPIEAMCDPRPILDRVVEGMRPIAERNGIELKLAFDENLPALRADRDQLHQMIVNFLDNAFRYGGPGCSVTLCVRKLDEAPETAGPLAGRHSLVISVSDDGPGIPSEHIPRLTERFYRVDTARSRRLGGTGLGLAIVKHILRRHGGHLVIESVVDEGSAFTVYLPLPEP